MRALHLAAVAGLALLAASAATAQTGTTSYTLTATNQGGQFVWIDDSGARNPTLSVPPSTEITLTAKQGGSDGIPHNIQVGSEEASDTFTEQGDSVDYVFTSPASGTVTYVCTIHPDSMKGTIRVASATGTDGGNGSTNGGGDSDGDNDSPGFGLLAAVLALAGVALVASRRRA